VAKASVRGVTLNYQLLSPLPPEERRSAECVVYLHGLMMDNLSSAYFTFAQAVSAERTLLLYDLRGHGKSEVTEGGYRVSDHARELTELLDALVLEGPLSLVGCSFGGAVALECARLYPERVARVALIDGHPHSSAFLTQLGADLTASPDVQRRLITQHFQHWLSRDVPRKRDRLAKRAHRLIEETSLIADLSASALESAQHTDVPLTPILALYGASSDALPLARSALATHSEVVWRVFEGRSHALLWEETEAVTQALCAWLRSTPL